MASATLNPAQTLTVEQYLATSYRPDRDFVDGEVLERHLGETPHSGLQHFIASIFTGNRRVWGLRPYPEQRVQVAPARFRVPDISLVRVGLPPGRILTAPPAICIEILSPEDTLRGLQDRIDDYLAFGVEHVWVLDPVRYRAWTADVGGLHAVTEALEVAGTPVRLELRELWAELEEIAAGR